MKRQELARRAAAVPAFVWVSILLPFGLGAWAPMLPAARLQRRSWWLWGALWSLVTLAGWLIAGANVDDGAAGLLIILGWVGGFATSLSIRQTYLEQMSSEWTSAKRQAQSRLEERREARRIVAEQPEVAVELGIGRPDRAGARDAGLVDVNNASAAALADLPGVDHALATRIVELRSELNGFSSVADLGVVLDLDGYAVERLRELVVFLPR